jgi:hypothetical protein
VTFGLRSSSAKRSSVIIRTYLRIMVFLLLCAFLLKAHRLTKHSPAFHPSIHRGFLSVSWSEVPPQLGISLIFLCENSWMFTSLLGIELPDTICCCKILKIVIDTAQPQAASDGLEQPTTRSITIFYTTKAQQEKTDSKTTDKKNERWEFKVPFG